ncbi:CPBP family glutamic-type intramembrane protease [Mesorhizobium marinum]|uniref:CPBP family glutamic-type intramembrane protease n=1 Tax=Mesorhizobium marinum TaxID=3228790 RepID=UPI0034655F5A
MTEYNQREAGGPHPEKLLWFARKRAGDFPFYKGVPVALTGPQWLIVLTGVVLGFAALIVPFELYQNAIGGFIPAILFFGIPLLALAFVAGRHWRAIFRRLVFSDVFWMVGVAALNLVVALAIFYIVRTVFSMNANPVGDLLGSASGAERVLFYLKTIPQLFGEEVVSILPFLAILWWCHQRLGMSRTASIACAWLGAAIFFGALHLPTYGWNFVQCFIVIGSARAVLLIGYIATKNIWVSTGSHILFDWLVFTVIVTLTGTALATP